MSSRWNVIFQILCSFLWPLACGLAKRSPCSGAIWTWTSAQWKSVGQFSGCAGGLIIKASPKSAAGRRILELPSWAVTMLRQRQPNDVDEDELAGQQIFPAPVAGGLRDPNNTLKMMRQAFRHAGFDGVTSHYFRKTVATLMDEAGLSARAAADQLGHAKPSLTADIYMGRRKRATRQRKCSKIFSSSDGWALCRPLIGINWTETM